MIREIPDEKHIVKTLRKTLIDQLELKNNQVLNALSFRGADLHKETEAFVFKTFSQNELIIIFELIEDDSSNNIVYTDEEDDVVTYSTYRFKLIIYGENSGLYSKKLRARLLTDEVLTNLEDEGIHIIDTTYPSSGTEFINDVIWERKDLDINFSVRFKTKKITTSSEFEEVNDINIIRI